MAANPNAGLTFPAILLWLAAGAALGWAGHLAVARGELMRLYRRFIEWEIKAIPYDDRRKLRMMGRDPAKLVTALVWVGVILMLFVAVEAKLGVSWFPVLLQAGLIVFGVLKYPRYLAKAPFARFQKQMLEGMGPLVRYLPVFAKARFTPLAALKTGLAQTEGPFHTHLAAAVSAIEASGDYEGALGELAEKAGRPEVASLFQRVSMAWTGGFTPDMFADISQKMGEVKKLGADAMLRSVSAKLVWAVMVAAGAWFVLTGGAFLLYMLPLLYSFLHGGGLTLAS